MRSTNFWELCGKIKLSSQSGSSLEAVELYPQKEAIKAIHFFNPSKIHFIYKHIFVTFPFLILQSSKLVQYSTKSEIY